MLTESTWVLVKRSWLTWGPAYLVGRQAGSLREASLMSPGLGPQVNLNLLWTAPLTEEEVPFLFFQHQKTTTSNPRLAPPCRQNNETGGFAETWGGVGAREPESKRRPFEPRPLRFTERSLRALSARLSKRLFTST